MSEDKNEGQNKAQEISSRTEAFLLAVESKTGDDIHRRILRACRSQDPMESMEAELKKIIEELLHET